MKTLYSAIQIANYFIARAFEENTPLTKTKLLKLVYIAFGWHSVFSEHDLFGEKIEAWPYGPVVPELYEKIQHYSNSEDIKYLIPYEQRSWWSLGKSMGNPYPEDPYTIQILDQVWMSYKRYSASTLSNMTHAEGTPWQKIFNHTQRSKEIPKDLIYSHYHNLYVQRMGTTTQNT